MKTKKLFGLAALCCMSMTLFACGDDPTPTPPPVGPTYYTVTFYSEGEVFDTKQAEANDTVIAPATDPTKAEHSFLGWFTDATEGVKWVFETDVVTHDMNLYAHFEASQVNYTVNFYLGDIVAETKTTNSHDKTSVTVPQVAVEEGKSLLGFGKVAGTTVSDVDYRVGDTLTYEDVVSLADSNNVVSLHAIVKTGDVLELNVAQWERYCDDACITRVMTAFKTYADDNSVDYDYLTVTKFASATSSDPNYKYADFAANVNTDKNVTVVFPATANFVEALTGLDNSRVKFSQSLGVDIKNAHGETTETGRLVARLSDDSISTAFVAWLLSDDGKVVLDPTYEPPTEHGEASATKLVIGVWGRYFSETLTNGLVDAYKAYLTKVNMAFDEVSAVYYDDTNYHSKANYLPAAADDLSVDVLLPVNKAIAKGTDSDIPAKMAEKYTTALNLGETDGEDVGLGLTIGGQTNRWLVTLNDDAITAEFVNFVKTEDGMKALDPNHGSGEVTQTTLKISYYGKFISEENANKVTEALENYFTTQGLSFGEHIITDYADGTTYNNNDKYTRHFNEDLDAYDISFGGKNNIGTSFTVSPVNTLNIGTIQGNVDRACYTFINGNLANAVLTYLQSADGIALLNTMRA